MIIFLCFQNQEHVDSQPKNKESRACLVFLCSILINTTNMSRKVM